jgi:hypothetical protein
MTRPRRDTLYGIGTGIAVFLAWVIVVAVVLAEG